MIAASILNRPSPSAAARHPILLGSGWIALALPLLTGFPPGARAVTETGMKPGAAGHHSSIPEPLPSPGATRPPTSPPPSPSATGQPAASAPPAPASAPEPSPEAAATADRSRQIQALMETSRSLEGVPFREVVKAATGHDILAIDPKSEADTALVDHVAKASDALIAWLNQEPSPVQGLRRINEASRQVEDQLRLLLNAGDFTCTLPLTTAGTEQRSGYPDLKIVHNPTGRVTYLAPKLYEAKSRASSLRTFYYEPRALTGKIRSDARHLLLGIAHDGKDGAWTFQSWDLVDLHDFHLRLKAEFQGSNRDLYRANLLLRRSPAPSSPSPSPSPSPTTPAPPPAPAPESPRSP